MSALMYNRFPLSIWIAYIVTASYLASKAGFKVGVLVVDEMQSRGFFGIENNKDDCKFEEILAYGSLSSLESASNEMNTVSIKSTNV